MQVHHTGYSGVDKVYTATSGRHSATGISASDAEWHLRRVQREARRNDEALGQLLQGVWSLAVKSAMVACNMVIRPLPTLLLGGVVWCAHWLAIAVLPTNSWWAWGAHAFFALLGLTAMATQAGAIEREEGIAINRIAERSHGLFQAVWWASMAVSIVASGFMAGLAFDWLVAHGLLQPDRFPAMREIAQCVAGTATFAWRGDMHPTLARATLPWFGRA